MDTNTTMTLADLEQQISILREQSKLVAENERRAKIAERQQLKEERRQAKIAERKEQESRRQENIQKVSDLIQAFADSFGLTNRQALSVLRDSFSQNKKVDSSKKNVTNILTQSGVATT